MSRFSRLWHFSALSLVLSLFAPVTASAAFIYTAQARSVTAGVFGPAPASQSRSASNFNLFDQEAFAQDNVGGGYADQYQRSELLPNSISVVGSFSGLRPTFAGAGSTHGRTIADITFNVTADTAVTLLAVISTNDGNNFPNGPRTVSLTGPSANISWPISSVSFPPNPWTGSRAQQLTLTPGSYRLLVDLDSYSAGFQPITTTVGSYNVNLGLPEPAAVGLIAAGAPWIVVRRERRRTGN